MCIRDRRKDYRTDSYIGMDLFGHRQDFNYLSSYKAYEKYQTLPFAMSFGGGLVLGAERYYLHDSYYRGLLGRTLVFNRALPLDEILLLARDQPLVAKVANDTGSDETASKEPKGMTFAAWIKPAAEMGKSDHGQSGGDAKAGEDGWHCGRELQLEEASEAAGVAQCEEVVLRGIH